MTLDQQLNRSGHIRIALYVLGFGSALVGSFLADGWPSAICVFGILAVFSAAIQAHNERLVVIHARLNQLWRVLSHQEQSK